MAPIMVELEGRGIDYNFIFSGQHKDTTAEIRANFGIKEPDVVLYDGPEITSVYRMIWWSIRLVIRVLRSSDHVWRGDKFGVVLNHGDTFSTLLGTVMARVSGLKSAHIESGLRSFNWFHPFPEEITRLLVFRLSTHYFAPGEWALNNLRRYRGEKVDTKLNTLADSLSLVSNLSKPSGVDLPKSRFAVVSFHRFENLYDSDRLKIIVEIIAQAQKEMAIVVVMHSVTQKRLQKAGLLSFLEGLENVELRPRYDYRQFVYLIRHAEYVMTDGGSNQEECFYLGKPCLLLRQSTERQEGLGLNVVISKFNMSVVTEFLDGYGELAKKSEAKYVSPTSIIVERLSCYS